MIVLGSPSPASAEIGQLQETWWGLDTKGSSRVLNGWTNDPLGWAVEPSGGAMLVGGQFLDITNGQRTIRQPYLAAFDAGDGTPLEWFTPDVGGPVLALESLSDGSMLVGGEMDTYNGVNLGALAKIDAASGELWPGWNTRVYGGSSVVRDIRLESDGWLYVVGQFTTASDGGGPQPVKNAIRMNPTTGAIDWNWLPQVAGGSVWGVSVSETTGDVYLGGWFTSINGNSGARGFGKVRSSDAVLLADRSTVPYNTCAGCTGYYRVYDVLATANGDVWVVGEQHAIFILEESNNLNMRLMHYTGCNRRYQNNCTRAGGEFQEIEEIGNRIYATCHCWGSHQTSTSIIYHSSYPSGTYTGPISTLAAYDPQSGERIQSVNPYMAGHAGGFAIAGTTDGCVWLAGGITQVGVPGNQRRARDLVRLCDAAGPGPDPQPNPVDPNTPGNVEAPATCSAINTGTAATIDWDASQDAVDYKVLRSIDGGTTYWRGRVTVTTFDDTLRTSGVHHYSVAARGTNGVWSAATDCAPDLDAAGDSADAPANCVASAVGQAANVSWDSSDNAVDYKVLRSIDASPQYWRGLVVGTSFDDTLRSSGTHTFYVSARGADGIWSTATTCAPPVNPLDGVDPTLPPATCTASNVATAATITWDASANAVDYRVYRSVDGSGDYWRGLTTATAFDDTLRNSGVHSYSVQARGADGTWTASTVCAPELTP